MTSGQHDWLRLGLITLAVLLVLGLATSQGGRPNLNYLVGVLLVIAIYGIFALGLSLQFGYTGLLNFGHVASMAIGAYTVALFFERAERMSPSLSSRLQGTGPGGVLACLLIAACVAVIVAIPANYAARLLLPQRTPRRLRAWAPLALAALVGLLTMGLLFPLGADGALGALVLLGILAAMVLAGLWGLLLGLPAVRLREDYLAIVTIGAAQILHAITSNEEWLTHGTLGIQSLHRPVARWARDTPWWEAFADALNVQATTLAHAAVAILVLALAFLMLQTLATSPWGRVLKSIREDEEAAASLGKNINAYKLQVLVIGSALGAIAGILYVWNLSNVYPEHFPSLVTFYGFIIVIVGGVGNHKGALAGAVLLWGVFELAGSITLLSDLGLDNLAGPPQGIAIGVLLVLVMMFRPQGALGRKQEMLYVR